MLEKLQCENCGGKLIEKDGVFVCESCGIGYKYTAENPYKANWDSCTRNPQLDEVYIVNDLNPDKIQSLASEFSRLANFGINLRR